VGREEEGRVGSQCPQGAGVAAAVSLRQGTTVRDVDMPTVQRALEAQDVRIA